MSDEVRNESITEDILEELPKEEQKAVKHFMQLSMQMARVSSPQAELMKKMTSENISEIAKLQGKELDLEYKDRHESKMLYIAVMVCVIVLIFGLIFLLRSQPDLLKEILVPIITLIVGSVGGYGFGKSRRDE